MRALDLSVLLDCSTTRRLAPRTFCMTALLLVYLGALTVAVIVIGLSCSSVASVDVHRSLFGSNVAAIFHASASASGLQLACHC